MKTIEYLKAAKRALGIQSDYALAKHLGITKAAMSLLANGHTAMSATTAAKIAGFLKLDPLRVIAEAELERGSSPELWKRIRDAAMVAAVAIGAASFGVVPSPLFASNVQPGSTNAGLCIMLNRRKRLPRWLAALALLRPQP